MTGVAIVGAGVAGRLRAAAVGRHPGTVLLAVADVDADRADAAVRGTSARAFADHRQAIERSGVEVVVVSTPGYLHEPIVLDALAAGRHVLCEKPLGIDVASCRQMIDAAERARRILAVGFNHRYYPCVKVLKAALDSGRIGDLDHVRAVAGHGGLSQFRADWMYRRDTAGGGAMMDVGIHITDLVRFVVGDVVEVTAACTNRVWNVRGAEDDALAIMRSAAGIPVRYQATWSEWKGYRLALEAYGTRGMVGAYYAPMANLLVEVDASGKRLRRRFDLHPWINVREKVRGWETTAVNAFVDELEDFLRLAAGKPTCIATGRDGLHAVAVAHAAYESSTRGAAVRVPE